MGLAMPRRPKPVDLHHLEGTYQRVRHDRRAVEPEAPGDLAELKAPKWLTERQRAIWDDVIKRAPRGILRASRGRPPVADRPLTRALRLGPLAGKGGPDEHPSSTARIHRWARCRGGVANRGAGANPIPLRAIGLSQN